MSGDPVNSEEEMSLRVGPLGPPQMVAEGDSQLGLGWAVSPL